jgi:hypothetical protein
MNSLIQKFQQLHVTLLPNEKQTFSLLSFFMTVVFKFELQVERRDPIWMLQRRFGRMQKSMTSGETAAERMHLCLSHRTCSFLHQTIYRMKSQFSSTDDNGQQGGYRLGSVPNESSQKIPSSTRAKHVVTLWANGFTVDEGPLRSFLEPQNAHFMQQLTNG